MLKKNKPHLNKKVAELPFGNKTIYSYLFPNVFIVLFNSFEADFYYYFLEKNIITVITLKLVIEID